VAFNLVKARERKARESVLRTEYAHAVAVLNAQAPPHAAVKYIAWDFSSIVRSA